uniref:Uncharacterized protein n=1 Tax=Plectus sambesii TaxID=2011161 RepID=A0A914WNV1_9BILA
MFATIVKLLSVSLHPTASKHSVATSDGVFDFEKKNAIGPKVFLQTGHGEAAVIRPPSPFLDHARSHLAPYAIARPAFASAIARRWGSQIACPPLKCYLTVIDMNQPTSSFVTDTLEQHLDDVIAIILNHRAKSTMNRQNNVKNVFYGNVADRHSKNECGNEGSLTTHGKGPLSAHEGDGDISDRSLSGAAKERVVTMLEGKREAPGMREKVEDVRRPPATK